MGQTLADAVIDFTEIHVLDVQPLSEWQRWLIRHVYAEPLAPLKMVFHGDVRQTGP